MRLTTAMNSLVENKSCEAICPRFTVYHSNHTVKFSSKNHAEEHNIFVITSLILTTIPTTKTLP